MKRLATSLVLIPTITYIVLWADELLFLAVLSMIALLCYREYDGMVGGSGIAPPGGIGYPLGLAALLLPHPEAVFVLSALAFFALSLRAGDLRSALPQAAAGALGMLYIFGSWRTGISLRSADPWWLLFACALNWVGDTAAFYVGRSIGKRKLAPRVSPGKSWEGAIASAVGSMLFAGLAMPRLLPSVPAWKWVAMAACANVAGQVGDLCESALKRVAGMKDSGNLLPGHGGWLDRVDSSLFAMPVVYLLKLLLVTS